MKDPLGEPSIATILVAVCVLIVVLVGGIVCVVNPDALSFNDYVNAIAIVGIGGGALGIGRGILAGAKANNPHVEIEAELPTQQATPSDQGTTLHRP